jgi:esterase
VDLFARELGGVGQPPLLLLHGLLGSSRNWQSSGADLARAGTGRPVWALDLRNHGKSAWAEPMDYPALVADVIAWLDARGFTAVDLVGHSLGGKVAMALACRQPTRVRRLVVVDIAPKPYRSFAHRAEFIAMHELQLQGLQSRAEAELRFEARVPDWAMRKFLTTNLERTEDGAWRWGVNLPVISAALPLLEANPLSPGEAYGGPTLVVRGGKSDYVLDADRPAISAFFPTAVLQTIPAAGHNPHMETRTALVALITAFLDA